MKKSDPLSDGSGWEGSGEARRERVPTVEFDFAAVFGISDGEGNVQAEVENPREPLDQILSPRELQVAFVVARKILRQASPLSQAARARWRNPVYRQRVIAASTSSAARRKRSDSLRRTWALKDKERLREQMLRLWREHRGEMLARVRRPECRKVLSEKIRTKWKEAGYRKKLLSKHKSPGTRLRKALSMYRYFREHPEGKLRRAETQRKLWRDPLFRARQCERIRAGRALQEKLFPSAQNPEARLRRALGMRRYIRAHPEVRQKRAEAQRRRWRDPEYRARHSHAVRAGKVLRAL